MKVAKFLTIIGLSFICTFLGAQSAADREAFNSVDWGWHAIAQDMEAGYARFNMFNSTQSISVVRYKAKSHKTDFLSCPAHLRSITSEAGKKHNATAALNGSYFNVKTLHPTTLFKDNGYPVGWTSRRELYRVNGLVCVKGRRIEVVRADDSLSQEKVARRYRECLASGPVLIDDGKSLSYDNERLFYTKRHPRTMIGITRDGWIYLVVVDGRFKGLGDGATIAQMTFLAECFGLYDALNLDGGGSSTVWNATDGTMNHPYDNHKFDHEGEREVPNVVLVY